MDNYELRIKQLINTLSIWMLINPNVVAVGRGRKIINGHNTKHPSLTFFVGKKMTSSSIDKSQIIPPFIKGVVTDVLECGEINIINEDKISNMNECISAKGIIDKPKPAYG